MGFAGASRRESGRRCYGRKSMFFFFRKNSRKYRGRFNVTFCLTNVSFRFYLESRGLTVNSFFGRTRFWRERIGTQFMMKWHFICMKIRFSDLIYQDGRRVKVAKLYKQTVGKHAIKHEGNTKNYTITTAKLCGRSRSIGGHSVDVCAGDIVDGPQWRNAWTDVNPWRGCLRIKSVQSIWGELHFLHLYCCIWNADA